MRLLKQRHIQKIYFRKWELPPVKQLEILTDDIRQENNLTKMEIVSVLMCVILFQVNRSLSCT